MRFAQCVVKFIFTCFGRFLLFLPIQPIRIRYLGHVTGYQPIRDQYFLIWSFPVTHHLRSDPVTGRSVFKQPIRTRYLGHVTGYYFLIREDPGFGGRDFPNPQITALSLPLTPRNRNFGKNNNYYNEIRSGFNSEETRKISGEGRARTYNLCITCTLL
eukprot:sb/3473040/